MENHICMGSFRFEDCSSMCQCVSMSCVCEDIHVFMFVLVYGCLYMCVRVWVFCVFLMYSVSMFADFSKALVD